MNKNLRLIWTVIVLSSCKPHVEKDIRGAGLNPSAKSSPDDVSAQATENWVDQSFMLANGESVSGARNRWVGKLFVQNADTRTRKCNVILLPTRDTKNDTEMRGLTAASCFNEFRNARQVRVANNMRIGILIGMSDLQKIRNPGEDPAKIIEANPSYRFIKAGMPDVVFHPNYKVGVSNDSDLAIIKIKLPAGLSAKELSNLRIVPFNQGYDKKVRELVEKGELGNTTVWSWANRGIEGTIVAKSLNRVTVRLEPSDSCTSAIGKLNLKIEEADNKLPAFDKEKGFCSTRELHFCPDSAGAPLILADSEKYSWLLGMGWTHFPLNFSEACRSGVVRYVNLSSRDTSQWLVAQGVASGAPKEPVVDQSDLCKSFPESFKCKAPAEQMAYCSQFTGPFSKQRGLNRRHHKHSCFPGICMWDTSKQAPGVKVAKVGACVVNPDAIE